MWGDRRAIGVGPRSASARAQTPIDFAVGAGVFLLTLAFVVAFVPTLFDPFTAAETASPLVSDRVAAGIAGDVLAASPAEPGVLSPACTVAFFESDESLATDAGCERVTESPADRFGVDGDVQVVIHALDEETPSENPSSIDVTTRHGTFGDVELSRSTDEAGATGGDDVAVSRRLVSIDGTQYRLTVRVW
ncbi:hypothetical protein U4E84_11970 [Halorubrum sp. AD140]|uniref:DUF7287 family protein n=1 Tax=Halorubrum sp. AD140 TaxID=3050073 RepID=UPI002ACC8826|nr:hypothetical protein [Halorubrum sp. AD140]MDZ5812059.1 hypothetical protein [Halorubrum sp. AD140]